jgi:hypothetical protein
VIPPVHDISEIGVYAEGKAAIVFAHPGRSHRVFSAGFFGDDARDFETRIALGQCAYGGGDTGEVLVTIAAITDEESWVREWTTLATRLRDDGERYASNGRPVEAGAAFLRAANYLGTALSGLVSGDDSDRLIDTFRQHRACWADFLKASDGAHVPIEVPYEDTTLPGWLLRPDASGVSRPTLVMTNGSDGPISHMWGNGAAEALARGWNAFVYDGPGQQSMFFERGVAFRPDWEAVLTPVVNALLVRPDVDAGRLTAYGISQAGYWLPRALSAERRFTAACVDPGVVDVSTSWLGNLPKSMIDMLDTGDRKRFNRDMDLAAKIPSLGRILRFRSRPFRQEDWFDTFTAVRSYELTSVASTIRTPLWIASPENEQFWPGQSERLAALVPSSHVERFTAAEGANFHCQPMGRRLTHERMFAWLADRLDHRGPVVERG